jgi:hypothetical protein
MNPCIICGEPVWGHGHNAEPVASGRCCDTCQDVEVMPARYDLIFSGKVWGLIPDWSEHTPKGGG